MLSNPSGTNLNGHVGTSNTPYLALFEVGLNIGEALDGLELEDDCLCGDVETVDSAKDEEHSKVEVGSLGLSSERDGPEKEGEEKGDEAAIGHCLP